MMFKAPALALALSICFLACKAKEDASAPIPFQDDFDRTELGENYHNTGGQWFVDNGTVYTTGANNAPLFLKADLPADVVVEVDVMSETDTVDSKIELMTDGRTHQSGYVFILGGWDNKLSVIARLDEHGDDRKTKGPTEALGNRWYHWRIEKEGGKIRWYLDNRLYMTFDDPEPLSGPGHNRFAFSNWQNRIRYDRLRIWPFKDAPPITTSTTAAQ